MTDIRITTLPNGLRIATDPMGGVETVSVGVWVEAGSRFESAPINGITHFLEHMVFKGTRRRDARAIAEEIEAVGGHLNAHTSRECTAFYAKVLKDDAALAVDLVGDIVQNATLDPTELNRERTVVLQEIMQCLDTPDDIIFDRFQETAFPGQSLGRPVLGSPDLIKSISRDGLIDYWQGHYRASRMILAAAGRIEHETLVALGERIFGDLKAGDEAVNEPASYAGGEYREFRDLEQCHLVIGFPGVGYIDDAFYPVSVLSTLLGGGMSSRLFQEAREKRGLVYSIYSFPASYTDTGLFGIYAGTGGDEVAELVPLIAEQLVDVCERVDPSEVARARAQLKASLLMALESTSSRCEQLARQLMVFGRPIPVAETVARIDNVSADDVMAVARRLFRARPTIATLGPISGVEPYEAFVDRLK